MASRALRGGRESAVDEGASRLLAAKIAGVFQRAATCVRGTSEVAARELESVEALGELFLKQGEVGEALAVFTSLSAGIRAGYETIWDEESEVGRILDACVGGLEGCLDAVEVDARGDILGALLDIAVWERMSGGYGIGERAAEVLLGRCDAGERRALGAAVAFVLERATLDSGARLGSFAVQLGGGAEEERAALLRETGEEHRRIARLLALHEPRDAALVLAELKDWDELLRCADLFALHGYAAHGRKVVEDAVASRRTSGRLLALTWLYGQVNADHRSAAAWAEEIFREAPSVEHWDLLRVSIKSARRAQIRQELFASGDHVLLLEILLSENKAREALSKLRAVKARTPRVLAAMRQIADGVAADRPGDAARLYAEIADARMTADEPEIAVGLVLRGHALLTAAGHPILAARHVADFCRRHADSEELISRMARHGVVLPELQTGSGGRTTRKKNG